MHAIEVHGYGGTEVLTAVERPDPSPGPGEITVDVVAAGVNYMDVYQRQGLSPFRPPLPFIAGNEGAGIVREVSADVAGFLPGERVAWTGALGGYATTAVVPAARALPVPADLELETAAAVLLQGTTAQYLSASAYAVKPGDVAVVHAAAGGVGLLLTQMITNRGGVVIATTSAPEKSDLARAAGAVATAGYDDFSSVVRRETRDRGADVVYDSVGRVTFDQSLASLAPRGTLVLFGTSSGPVPPFDLQRLAATSAFITRPTLAHYAGTRQELVERGSEVLASAANGSLTVRIGGRYDLADAARAHADLEARRTSGKLLLVP
ncbi:quinone oxidoreductase [Microbacter sp. GSS18]|nr:quinone oxidoreductase [Microbacter sp. GSS18]